METGVAFSISSSFSLGIRYRRGFPIKGCRLPLGQSHGETMSGRGVFLGNKVTRERSTSRVTFLTFAMTLSGKKSNDDVGSRSFLGRRGTRKDDTQRAIISRISKLDT